MQAEPIQKVNLRPLSEPGRGLWKRLLVTGIFTILLGAAAILLPFIATLTIEALVAAILIVAGLIHLIHGIQSPRGRGRGLRLFAGVLYCLVGGALLVFPMKGALTLTALLGFLFVFGGAFKIAHAVVLRPLASWTWLMVNGFLGVLLGVLIWVMLPDAAGWVIGLLVGIELILSGWSMTLYAVSLREHHDISSEPEITTI